MPEESTGSDLILSEQDRKAKNSFTNLLDRIPHLGPRREIKRQAEEIDRLTKTVVAKIFQLMSEEGILTLSRDRSTGELIEEIYQGDILASDDSHFFALAAKSHQRDEKNPHQSKFLLALTEHGGRKRELQIRQGWYDEEFTVEFNRTPDKPLESTVSLGGSEFYVPSALTFDEKKELLRSLSDPKINPDETNSRYKGEIEQGEKDSIDTQRPRVKEVLWAKDKEANLST